MTREQLRAAIVALCQDFGIVCAETYDKLNEMLDTITDGADLP